MAPLGRESADLLDVHDERNRADTRRDGATRAPLTQTLPQMQWPGTAFAQASNTFARSPAHTYSAHFAAALAAAEEARFPIASIQAVDALANRELARK
jgi:hypothetical protein